MTILRRLRSWLRWRRFDADLRAELDFHRTELQQSLEQHGMPPKDAARESRRLA